MPTLILLCGIIAVSWYAWLAFRIRVNMSAIGSVMVMGSVFYFLGLVSVRTCSVSALSGFGAAVFTSCAAEPRRFVVLVGVAQGRPCRARAFAPMAATMREESSILITTTIS
jgi:hypothetical protein